MQTSAGSVAGNLVLIDSFKVAAWAASAYPADVWLSLSPTEQSPTILELRGLDAAYTARGFDALAKLIDKVDC